MTAQEHLTGMPTPGPWKSNGYQITDPEGIRLADCWFGPNRPFNVAEANAALIVKAVNAYTSTDALREAARKAHDTLLEINTSNYDHDDVCELNSASVEAILILADALGERHGKSEQWWNERRAALSGSPAPSTSARYPEETGWLVEMNDVGPKYYSFSERDPDDPWGGFQRDPNKAIRFARKEDAEAMIAAFGWTPGHVYAAEHIWGGEKIAGSPAPSTEGLREALAPILSLPDACVESLRHQRQVDADGCEVGVSRQAVDEIYAAIVAARTALAGVTAPTSGGTD